MSYAKVVGIRGNAPFQNGRVKALPDVLIALRELSKERVQKLLLNLFDGADDALFAMADKAGSNQEQATYFDAMRELRIQKRHIASATLKKVIQSFNEIGQLDFADVPEDCDSLDDLSLIKNDELEIKVAIESMVTRLRNVSGDRLDALQARVSHLLEGYEFSADQTPCSPEVLCHGFSESCEELELDIKAKLIFMKLFERFVMAGMVTVYDEMNNALAQRGILPDYKKKRARRKQSASAQPAAQSPNIDSATTGDGMINQSYGDPVALNSFEGLRQLLHPQSQTTHNKGVGHVPSGGANQQYSNEQIQGGAQAYFSHGELIDALSHYQNDQLAVRSNLADGAQLIDFRSLISQNLNQQAETESHTYSEVDSDVINLVSMLFEFILDDRQLQPQMKALIARLQIPILKVAIIDRNFFNKGGHAARKLLNEIALAAVGWNPSTGNRKDRLKDKIESIVDTISNEFDDDVSLFDTLLQDLITFVDQEKRRGLLVEQRTKDSERGKAAAEHAKKTVQDFLNQAVKDRPLPEFSLTLLRDAWSAVMVMHHLKEGEQSEAWQKACVFVEELIWSLCPDVSEKGARGRLLKMIPNLVTRFRNGLSEISYDERKTKALLKKLEDHHVLSLQALQQQVDLSDTVIQQPSQVTISKQEVCEAQDDIVADLVRSTMELEEDFERMMNAQQQDETSGAPKDADSVETGSIPAKGSDENLTINAPILVEPLETEHEEIVLVPDVGDDEPTEILVDEHDPLVKQVDAFAVGCWFEFQGESGQAERCKLAAIIKATGRYIFVNRAGVKVAEKKRLELASALRDGKLQLLNDGLLFDRALESIITNLRSE